MSVPMKYNNKNFSMFLGGFSTLCSMLKCIKTSKRKYGDFNETQMQIRTENVRNGLAAHLFGVN